jgi:ADP-ribose pyrophosphatase YjhB (NUDIX family)
VRFWTVGGGNGVGGFEELLEEGVRRKIYEETGVWVEADAFDA